ncbi:30S ribosomal protein S6 [uncultured Ruminococcus sp.]|uniref:30S ribosomal protein S6 n=1 Tax=uncultured Ruminococcus sp. TaxID=165186 RepID=UPI0025F21349|nr:30S ribosomal protein S6 [uncultured Ruminococcus sp.]
MAKINESYEAMVIFSSKLDEEGVKALTEKFNALIEANATDVELSNWGKRKLAYAINYETEGTYVLWTFTSKTDFPAELERILKITDGVIRFLVTVK